MLAGIGGRTVAEAEARMSRGEFCDWYDRYVAEPFDDAHRFHRPAAWLAFQFNGVQPRESMKWLTDGTMPAAPDVTVAGQWSDADRATLATLGFGKG